MKIEFLVNVQKFTLLDRIEGAWQPADFTTMLDDMDFGDVTELSESEAREMCLMSLQDLQPEGAAAVVLRHRLGDTLSKGQIENIANEMLDEKMWEEYADMTLHEQMFAVGSLLYEASPNVFPEPDAVEVTLEVAAVNQAAQELLREPLHESLLVRLLADGMDEHAVLHRVFGEQLSGPQLPEADKIVWIVRQENVSEALARVVVISSGYWLDALRETRSYASGAHPDED